MRTSIISEASKTQLHQATGAQGKMKSVIFTIAIHLLLMLPVVLAYKNMCYTCHKLNSETCKHEVKECTDSDCMIISEEFRYLNKTSHSISKGCARNLPCNTYLYAYSGPDVSLKLFMQCCKGEKCNNGNFSLPKIETEAKGILCPSCYAFNTTAGCNTTRWSVCLGEDDKCVSFKGTLKPPGEENVDFSAKGCSSKDACDMDYSETVGMRVMKQMEYKCYVPTAHDKESYKS